MARGRKQQSGLDLSGVGKPRLNVRGGGPKGRPGLAIPDKKSGRYGLGNTNFGHRDDGYIGHERTSRGSVIRVVIFLVLVLALAVGVGAIVYSLNFQNAIKSELDTQALSAMLAPVESETDPSWAVLVKTDSPSAEAGRGNLVSMALLHADPESQMLCVLWTPINVDVYMDGYGYRNLAEAFSLEEEAGAIRAANRLGGIEVSHYFEVSDAGLRRLNTDLAPLSADLTAADPQTAMAAVSKRLFGASSEQLSELSEVFTNCVVSDLDANGVAKLFGGLRGMNADKDVYQIEAPVTTKEQDGDSHVVLSSDAWNTIVARVGNGMTPQASRRELSEYATMRASTVVEIWNGVGVSGVAGDCSNELKNLGWNLGEVGNAAQFVYSETLVVYRGDDDRELAELIVSDLGQGRVVRSAARYSFKGDVLVVVGKDYQPY